MIRRRVARVALAALVLSAAAATAPRIGRAETADLEQARAHFDTGESLFAAGRYRAALSEFARADALVPSPINSYNMALCHDELGEREAALRAYRAYLEEMPEASNRRAVEARISALEPPPADEAGEAAREPALEPSSAEERAPEPPPEAPSGESSADAESKSGAPPAAPFPQPERRAEAAPPSPKPERASGPGEPAPASPPVEEPDSRREETPLYKSWWFWGVAGVSAYILLNIATAESSGGTAGLEPLSPSAPSGGVTLWRF